MQPTRSRSTLSTPSQCSGHLPDRLFAGLRCDEIRRLTVGCIRWQHNTADETGVCLLDVPLTKPDLLSPSPSVPWSVRQSNSGEAAERPSQPRRCTQIQWVDALFVYRGKPIGQTYLNELLIPLLCRKANVPLNDARGRITSHRARSTIASQLANAREPMSLVPGVAAVARSSLSQIYAALCQDYAHDTDTRLYRGAYFDRNLRTIQVRPTATLLEPANPGCSTT